MIVEMELPEICPVCDEDTIYVSFKKSKETKTTKEKVTENGKEKEVEKIIEKNTWEETARYNCGCVLEYTHGEGFVVKTPCPNAHRIAVELREMVG